MSKKVLECLELNKEVANKRLAIYTWGNVSVRDGSIVNIKPSGIPFNSLKEEDISQVDIETGRLIKGKKPSVDTAIHLEIYKAFPNTGAVIHTHSTYASTLLRLKKTFLFWVQLMRIIFLPQYLLLIKYVFKVKRKWRP